MLVRRFCQLLDRNLRANPKFVSIEIETTRTSVRTLVRWGADIGGDAGVSIDVPFLEIEQSRLSVSKLALYYSQEFSHAEQERAG